MTFYDIHAEKNIIQIRKWKRENESVIKIYIYI